MCVFLRWSDVQDFETLLETAEGTLRRSGRFLIQELSVPHVVLSTSVRNGGQQAGIRYLVNHQSCEGSGHTQRHDLMTAIGQDGYHDSVCAELKLMPDHVAMMGTAANMNYVAISKQQDLEVCVTAIVTAGVQGNATCAGDPADWRETDGVWEKIKPFSGTINTMLLINHPLTAGALARSVMTMTEGKSAALQRLAVGSLYSQDQATGTGTDQYCLAAPLFGKATLSSASTHVKLGELIGLATRTATAEALRWQNGMESSYTRGLFHIFGRYGLSEKKFWEDISLLLKDDDLQLLKKNSHSVFYEPLVSASAYSFVAVLDRIRYGTLPEATASEALRQSAALLAANLAAKPHQVNEFRVALPQVDASQPLRLLVSAMAAGWAAKWT
jgi:adenosylcobinamide amidohydrolase